LVGFGMPCLHWEGPDVGAKDQAGPAAPNRRPPWRMQGSGQTHLRFRNECPANVVTFGLFVARRGPWWSGAFASVVLVAVSESS
jgi:hypothetical protein